MVGVLQFVLEIIFFGQLCLGSQENQSTFQQTSFSGKIDFGQLGHGYTMGMVIQFMTFSKENRILKRHSGFYW